jgi:uncharacterized protein YraI
VIEVIGSDGRVHAFADGTSQAQIDAALAAIYGAPAAPPVAHQPPNPLQYGQQRDYDRPQQSPRERPRSLANSITTTQILAGALGVAIVALFITLAFVVGRDRLAPTAAQTPKADVAALPVEPQVAVAPIGTSGPAVTPEAFAGFISTPKGGKATVRGQAMTTAPQITKLPHGAPVSVTGSIMTSDGLWRQVSIAGTTGFVRGDLISQTKPAPIALPAQPTSPAAGFVPREFWGLAVTRSSNTVNMRASPATTAAVVASIPAGTSLYVVGEQGGWYLVEWKGKRGWTKATFVERDDYD